MTDVTKSKESESASRRRFLKTAGAAAAVTAATGWAKSPAFALAPARVIGANDRINIGHIGVGRHATGRGLHHLNLLKAQAQQLNIQSVALSDIYTGYVQAAMGVVQFPSDKVYHDYRKLLDDKDVDVVWIASPEHWHAKMAIDAMEAGKD